VREIVAVLITLSACAKAPREDSVGRGASDQAASQAAVTADPEPRSATTTDSATTTEITGAAPPPRVGPHVGTERAEGGEKVEEVRGKKGADSRATATGGGKRGNAKEAARTSGGLGTTDHPGLFEPLADDPIVIGMPALAGGGDATMIAQALAGRRAAIGQCTAKADTGIVGTVALSFTVLPGGKLDAVKVVRSTTKVPTVDRCIVAALRGATLTGSLGPKPVKGTVSIELQQTR
jgi:TonB family protein